MILQIFDVEHGACSLLTGDNYARLMIDCGHNATTGWKPGTFLKQSGISELDMLAVTNYDEDHVSGARDLFDNINIKWIWRNASVSTQNIRSLKSEAGMGAGMDRLISEIDSKFSGGATTNGPPIFSGATDAGFCNTYPTFVDENNLSLAIFLKCHGVGVMFTGDLEVAGFETLLANNLFRDALGQTRVYFASHHGRQSGCSQRVAELLTNVNYVIISDKGYQHDTQETLPFYRAIAHGGPFRQENRRVLTTRRDGLITFTFSPNSWGPY